MATANRLKPAFVVVTGDLINDASDTAQAAEYQRIAARLDSKIRLFSLPGNHDVGNEPTKESLARYRERFGPDYYTFRVGDIAGVQTLFAISDMGRPLGVAVFVRSAHERFAVLHLGVEPRLSHEVNTRVLLKLMHEIRSAARRTHGVDRIELVYKDCHAVRLHG